MSGDDLQEAALDIAVSRIIEEWQEDKPDDYERVREFFGWGEYDKTSRFLHLEKLPVTGNSDSYVPPVEREPTADTSEAKLADQFAKEIGAELRELLNDY